MTSDLESTFMAEALARARRGLGHTRPNPPVGAVIVGAERILGAGYHHRAGQPHAEVMALSDVRHKGFDASGATLYVTLEPCSKAGRVGACTDAIREAGLARVVYAMPDPNPVNRGCAKRILARAGIVCERFCGAPEVRADAARLIAPFAKHIMTGLPFVTVKLAMSLDGRICDDNGRAKWISSAAARTETGKLRAEADAILVGAETIRKDDPSLLCHTKRNPDLIRAVVSKSGNLPKDAQVFTDGKNPTLVFSDAAEALRDLGRRGCLHVLCEGGLKLATSLAEQGLVDEWLTVLSPCVIGSRSIDRAVRFPWNPATRTVPKEGDCLIRFTI